MLAGQTEVRADHVADHRAVAGAHVLRAAEHFDSAVAIDVDGDCGPARSIAPVGHADPQAALDGAGRGTAGTALRPANQFGTDLEHLSADVTGLVQETKLE